MGSVVDGSEDEDWFGRRIGVVVYYRIKIMWGWVGSSVSDDLFVVMYIYIFFFFKSLVLW